MIYQPPGPLCNFFDGMDALLSCFLEDGTSLVVLGDFNIHPEKLQSPEFINFFDAHPFSIHPQSREPTRPCLHKVLRHLGTLLPPSLCLTTILSLSPSP